MNSNQDQNQNQNQGAVSSFNPMNSFNFMNSVNPLNSVNSVNYLNELGQSQLMVACVKGDIKRVILCLESGADISLRCKVGLNALHCAILGKNTEVVSHMSQLMKPFVNQQDNNGMTPLHYAVVLGDPLSVLSLDLIPELDRNILDRFGNAPIHYSIIADGIDCFLLLLSSKLTNLDLKGRNGWTPLMMASKIKDKTMVVELIQNGAQVEDSLLDEIIGNNEDIDLDSGLFQKIRMVLNNGGRLESINGRPIIHCLVENDCYPTFRLMQKRRFDLHLKDDNGETPLMIAQRLGLEKFIKRLIE